MKKIILFCFTFSAASNAFSQDNVSINFAQHYSTFKYTDSQGNTDPNMSSSFRSGFGLSYSKVFHSGFFIRPEMDFKNLGAVSNLYNQKLDWSLNYFDVNLGFGCIKHFGSFAPFIGISPYISYLYKASQTIGSDTYDLIADKGIKTSDYGLTIFGGLKYQFTEITSLFAEISNTTGLMQLETNSESGQNQKLYNRAVSFHFGISFNLVSKKRARMKSNF